MLFSVRLVVFFMIDLDWLLGSVMRSNTREFQCSCTLQMSLMSTEQQSLSIVKHGWCSKGNSHQKVQLMNACDLRMSVRRCFDPDGNAEVGHRHTLTSRRTCSLEIGRASCRERV